MKPKKTDWQNYLREYMHKHAKRNAIKPFSLLLRRLWFSGYCHRKWTRVQFLDEVDCISLDLYNSWEKYVSNNSPAMGKSENRLDSLTLV